MMNVNSTQYQTGILEELSLIVSGNNFLKNESTEKVMKIVLKAIEEINEAYNDPLWGCLRKLRQKIKNDPEIQTEDWKSIKKTITVYHKILTSNSDDLQPKISEHFVKINLSDIESDLQEADWLEVVNEIEYVLKWLYHPGITNKTIEEFKQDMFAKDGFSLKNLKNSIKTNFAVGHLGIGRAAFYKDLLFDKINHPDKNRAQINLQGYKGRMCAYLYNDKFISYEDIKKFEQTLKKISLKFLKTENGNAPIIKIPSFSFREDSFVEEINAITQIIGRNYQHIIIDLRGNGGGDLIVMYYFLSLFLGNNDPDIYEIKIDAEFCKDNQITPSELEQNISNIQLKSIYECHFNHKSIMPKKDEFENLTFEKMIVLIDDATFSGGEIAAAVLKNTLGSKVCILGKPGRGSFENRVCK